MTTLPTNFVYPSVDWQRECMQYLDLLHNPLEIADTIQELGALHVDVDPYIDLDRR